MSKKKRALVRLWNGVLEGKDDVNAIVIASERFHEKNLAEFVLLAKWLDGRINHLPDSAVKVARKYRFLLPEEEEPVLYDNVRDVLKGMIIWENNTPKRKGEFLHDDQTNLRTEDWIETEPEPEESSVLAD